jgi:4'-phosphopantetheinyl transferase
MSYRQRVSDGRAAWPGRSLSIIDAESVWWHSLGESELRLGQDWLSAAEVERLMSMRFAKRRRDWLLARLTGKQAVAHNLGLSLEAADLARVELRTVIAGAAKGAPELWVDGVRVPLEVSLTDRAGWAVCSISGSTGGADQAGGAGRAGIGCDLELVEPRSPAFVADYLTTREQAAVSNPPFDASADVMANLIWSAKESAMKVLRTGLRSATRSVEVSIRDEPALRDWRPLAVRAEEGTVFPGWWRQYGQFLLTIVAATSFPPPHSFVEPPALAAALPSHSWMGQEGPREG